MSIVARQVRRAQQRLTVNTIMARAALGIVVASLAWSLILVTERAFVLGIPLITAVLAACGLAIVIAGVGAYLARGSALHAALVVDQAAGLKERLSTALAVGRSSDPFARAATADAEKVARGIHVPTHVPMRAPELWPWSAATVAIAALLYGFMPKLDLLAQPPAAKDDAQAPIATKADRQDVETRVNEQLDRVRKGIEDNPALKDLAADLQPLEIPESPNLTPEDVRREAVKKLDKVADQLAEKRDAEELRSLDDLKNQLARIDPKDGRDPASKLMKDLASGDTQSAKQSLDDIKKSIEEAAKTSDGESKQKLEQMAQKMEELSKQLDKLGGDDTKMQKELENKAGMSAEDAKKLMNELGKMDPKQLEKELQKRLGESGMKPNELKELAKKMAENQEVKKQLKEMAKQMKKASDACKKCSGQQGQQGQQGQPQAGQQGQQSQAQQDASDALDGMQGQLSEMEMAEQMLNELDAQMSELEEMRQGMCQGQGQCDKPGDQIGEQGGNYGQGYGARIGRQAGAHQLKASRVRGAQHGGQIIGEKLIDGPQLRGQATAETHDAIQSALRDATDAIEHDQIPRMYERVVREYFEALAGLAKEGATAEQPAEPAKDQPATKENE